MIHRERRRLGWALLAAALCAGPTGRAGATQYDMILLDPNGGVAYGIDHGNAVGANSRSLVIWSNNGATVTPLAVPPGAQAVTPRSISGSQVAGSWVDPTHQQYALMWSGPNDIVYLSSRSSGGGIGYATATDGAQQVGVVSGGIGGDAGLWSGTAASFVNLNTSGYDQSYAQGVYGGMQVGYGTLHGGTTNALLWHGTASSFAVLSTGAKAMGISRGQVVGITGNSRPGSLQDAAIWNLGTPTSFVDVAPANTTASELLATNGTQQVGDYSTGTGILGQLPMDHHAAVWTGISAGFVSLPAPSGDNYSEAYSIDGDGNIAGVAGFEEPSTGGLSGVIPVLSIPHRLPGDANFDGTVNFSDLLILAQHYGQPGEWVDGEFSGGGTVDFADLLTLAQNYGRTQSAEQLYSVEAATGGTVPEPAGLLLIAGAILAASRRRSGSGRKCWVLSAEGGAVLGAEC